MKILRIDSTLESGEHVVKRFSGSYEGKRGTWIITNRRLIHLPSPEVKMDLKKTIVGGALFGGIGGTLGTKIEMPPFREYRLDNLISIDVATNCDAKGKSRDTLKATFRAPGLSDKETLYIIDVQNPHDFRSEVMKAKNKLEEEIIEDERAKMLMMKDEKMQELSAEIESIQNELKELENKARDLDIAYAIGRISKETYLEKMKEDKLNEKIDSRKSVLEAKKKELAERKERYI